MNKEKIAVSWNEIENMVEKLVLDIRNSEIIFDGIYGIPRGGLPLAVMMSHQLNLPVLLYPTKNSLVVDDISDNGFTLERMKNKKIATLYTTEWTITPPTWFAAKKENENHWIIFPWECDDE